VQPKLFVCSAPCNSLVVVVRPGRKRRRRERFGRCVITSVEKVVCCTRVGISEQRARGLYRNEEDAGIQKRRVGLSCSKQSYLANEAIRQLKVSECQQKKQPSWTWQLLARNPTEDCSQPELASIKPQPKPAAQYNIDGCR
jgi:hypothetical protein